MFETPVDVYVGILYLCMSVSPRDYGTTTWRPERYVCMRAAQYTNVVTNSCSQPDILSCNIHGNEQAYYVRTVSIVLHDGTCSARKRLALHRGILKGRTVSTSPKRPTPLRFQTVCFVEIRAL